MKSRDVVSVFSEGQFSTVSKHDWMNREKPLFHPSDFSRAGILIGAYVNEDHGYVVECRPERDAPVYSSVWCPRLGDVNAFLMGPGLAFLKFVFEREASEQQHAELVAIKEQLIGVQHQLVALTNGVPKGRTVRTAS